MSSLILSTTIPSASTAGGSRAQMLQLRTASAGACNIAACMHAEQHNLPPSVGGPNELPAMSHCFSSAHLIVSVQQSEARERVPLASLPIILASSLRQLANGGGSCGTAWLGASPAHIRKCSTVPAGLYPGHVPTSPVPSSRCCIASRSPKWALQGTYYSSANAQRARGSRRIRDQ